jgi:integrase
MLHIERSLSSGRHLGPPKGGPRTVSMSRRLWNVLLTEHTRQGAPTEGWVCRVDAQRYVERSFRPTCERAGIGGAGRKFHDLRDTFCSALFTSAMPRELLIKQSGHESWATTKRHYAVSLGLPPSYVADIDPARGDVWADAIAQLERTQ